MGKWCKTPNPLARKARPPKSELCGERSVDGTAGLNNVGVVSFLILLTSADEIANRFGQIGNFNGCTIFINLGHVFQGSHGGIYDRLYTPQYCVCLKGSLRSASSLFSPGVRLASTDRS